jgi:hypothetical protein
LLLKSKTSIFNVFARSQLAFSAFSLKKLSSAIISSAWKKTQNLEKNYPQFLGKIIVSRQISHSETLLDLAEF